MKVLELYSGIGGMHCALKDSGIPHKVVAAIDVNTTANKIYKHNFPGTKLMDCGIESLTARKLDEMKINMILMSPPCQPFTRVGKKLDAEDIRTSSFLHLLSLLPRLNNCPKYILVENVKGFEESDTCLKLRETLRECNFAYQEFMLSPLQFDIPNSRLRYYLIAKRAPLKFSFETSAEILTFLPEENHLKYVPGKSEEGQFSTMYIACDTSQNNVSDKDESKYECTTKNTDLEQSNKAEEKHTKNLLHGTSQGNSAAKCPICREQCLQTMGHNMRQITEDDSDHYPNCCPVLNFLEDKPPDFFDSFLLTKKELKRFLVMDIVFPCLKKTTCFTKRYGHFMEGAGSIFQMSQNIYNMKEASELKDRTQELKNRADWTDEDYEVLSRLRLRYFTPREIANFLCFPSTYDFPTDLSRIQLYRTLGNSLNVHVVSALIQLMVKNPE
ncbi:tRNA (cytosine(38)-C(5))-methyltransferase-like [Saccostrea echinata]|uniref:tRNA (cytosine(38)-C(5))-methyltransferase-like n=1 Tax=Saccostrea echinata TaxID=191078 RepID=UPI002A7EFA97|nr:tRNA (cytosine(38)-C(5))-methyltransferase-like [Saccostrea echinata]